MQNTAPPNAPRAPIAPEPIPQVSPTEEIGLQLKGPVKDMYEANVTHLVSQGMPIEEARTQVLQNVENTYAGQTQLHQIVEAKQKEIAMQQQAEVMPAEQVTPDIFDTISTEPAKVQDMSDSRPFDVSQAEAPSLRQEPPQKATEFVKPAPVPEPVSPERENPALDRSPEINKIRVNKTQNTKSYADIKNISPDTEVTIYRAVPKESGGKIEAGDFVATDKEVAKFYANDLLNRKVTNEAKYIKMKVKASEIRLHPDHQAQGIENEFIYNPAPEPLPLGKSSRNLL